MGKKRLKTKITLREKAIKRFGAAIQATPLKKKEPRG